MKKLTKAMNVLIFRGSLYAAIGYSFVNSGNTVNGGCLEHAVLHQFSNDDTTVYYSIEAHNDPNTSWLNTPIGNFLGTALCRLDIQ